MWRNDPYFNSNRGPLLRTSYVEDILKTYGKQPVPKRNSETYERALAFRERERTYYQNILEKNSSLEKEVQTYRETLERHKELTQKLGKSIKQINSKRNSNASHPGGSGGTSSDGKDTLQSGEKVGEPSDAGVSGEVLRADVPDPSGHAEEHADEGRQADPADTTGGVRAD